MEEVEFVRQRNVVPWLARVEELAGRLDSWRELLSTHYPMLARAHMAGELVPEAHVAVAKVLAVMVKRVGEFAFEASRSGPLWETFRNEHAASCVAVLAVSVKLTMAATDLIHDEALLPPRDTTRNTYRLVANQRLYLQRAETGLGGQSGVFLAQVQSVFITGHRLWFSSGSLQSVGADQLNTVA